MPLIKECPVCKAVMEWKWFFWDCRQCDHSETAPL